MLQQLAAGQATLALLLGHLVDLVQLPYQALLVAGRKPVEVRIIAQHPLLVLRGNSAVLIEPVAEVAWGRRSRIAVARTSLARIG